MLKLIATDLDHTLLNEDKTISPETLSALQQAMAEGVTVTVATGRSFRSANKYAKMIGEDCRLISYNGALIKNGDETIFEESLPVELVQKLTDFAVEEGLFMQIYEDHKILFDKRVEPIWIDADIDVTGKIEIEHFHDHEFQPSPKALIVLEPERREAVASKLRQLFGDVLFITRSQDFLIEIMMNGVNKGAGLAKLADSLGIAQSEVMACGDNGNDVEMIQWAGCGVAVANAVDAAKEAADYVTSAERSLGVREAVEKFVLKNK